MPGGQFPRSEFCARCDRQTTHVRQGCTRCMGRADNRKQGVLFAAIGGGLVIAGLALTGGAGIDAREDVRARSSSNPRRRGGGRSTLSGLLLFGGGGLLLKGLAGVLFGRDPEAP